MFDPIKCLKRHLQGSEKNEGIKLFLSELLTDVGSNLKFSLLLLRSSVDIYSGTNLTGQGSLRALGKVDQGERGHISALLFCMLSYTTECAFDIYSWCTFLSGGERWWIPRERKVLASTCISNSRFCCKRKLWDCSGSGPGSAINLHDIGENSIVMLPKVRFFLQQMWLLLQYLASFQWGWQQTPLPHKPAQLSLRQPSLPGGAAWCSLVRGSHFSWDHNALPKLCSPLLLCMWHSCQQKCFKNEG